LARRAALAAKEAALAGAEAELAGASARGAAAAARAAKGRERLQEDEDALASLHAEADSAARAAAAAQVRGLRSVPAPARALPAARAGRALLQARRPCRTRPTMRCSLSGPRLSTVMPRMMLARGTARAATRTQAQTAGGLQR
jgi:hypothetical protein